MVQNTAVYTPAPACLVVFSMCFYRDRLDNYVLYSLDYGVSKAIG